MFYGKEQKIETAKRLKKLRNNYNNGRGISHEKLAEELNERYSDLEKSKKNNYLGSAKAEVISSGVLKNYEITDFNHSKFNAGYGMNISYLTMLADFYGVTTDYLLGRTGVKSPDIDIQGIHEKTGLSEDAINQLTRWKDGLSNPKSGEGYKTFCNGYLNFISKLIIHHLMGAIPMRMSEIRLERERREAMEGKLGDEKDMSTLLLHNVLAYEQAQKHNQTVTGTRMIPAADYESYLLNDITTTFRKIVEDILSDNK